MRDRKKKKAKTQAKRMRKELPVLAPSIASASVTSGVSTHVTFPEPVVLTNPTPPARPSAWQRFKNLWS
jgi:hypothetical protein